ncbi:TPA: ParB N-terminal domain-containing protein, partial [Corynebacterium striatum]|nr:ParB N-terminal domain-containing protein [Corynebacterium striatum]HCG3159764.1 ParB N-terminal domain-containing protein [Corynebacterium striatum]
MTMTPISQLKFYPGNARRGDIDLIAESLQRLGQYKPVVVNTGGKCPELADTILAGNHTVMAAQRLGWDSVDVHLVDLDADTAKRVVIVDNKANDEATYEVEELV